MPMAVDVYLLWSISEDGAVLATDMRAVKDVLGKDDNCRFVTYMCAGGPKADATL